MLKEALIWDSSRKSAGPILLDELNDNDKQEVQLCLVEYGCVFWLDVLVVDVVMYSLTRLQRQSENLLVVGDQLRKGPPSAKVPQRTLETHDLGTSRNIMEKERGSFGLRDAPEGRAAMFIWRFG